MCDKKRRLSNHQVKSLEKIFEVDTTLRPRSESEQWRKIWGCQPRQLAELKSKVEEESTEEFEYQDNGCSWDPNQPNMKRLKIKSKKLVFLTVIQVGF
ncbi:hypothetical protein R6Q59_035465 [Mikania micrantha]